jgi:hypothetical protein
MNLKLPTKLPQINFKAILQKLSILKNNVSLLVAVIIVAVSILLFIPTGIISAGLKKQIKNLSLTYISEIQRYKKDVQPASQLQLEEKRLTAMAEDVNKIDILAKQTTQRQYINKDVFTIEPNNSFFTSSIFTDFGKSYCSGIEKLIADGKAGTCITESEIKLTLTSQASSFGRKTDTSIATALTRPKSASSFFSQYSAIELKMIDQICQQKAASLSYYVAPEIVSGYTYWKGYSYQDFGMAVENCWYYQLSYWIIEDIFKTIQNMNSGHTSALDAPVKRLMETSFTTGINRPAFVNVSAGGEQTTTENTATVGGDRPKYMLTEKDILTETCTNRYCNADTDITQFRIKLIISSDALFEFMKELCSEKDHVYTGESGKEQIFKHNQITILETSFRSIDTESADHELYRYGENNVSEVELVCEYSFVKKGYDDIKPKTIKIALGEKGL